MEARDLLEELAREEQKKVADRTTRSHVYRGPLLARMELLKQFEKHKLHKEIELGESLSVCLSVCLSVYLYMYVHQYLIFSLSVRLSWT